VKSGMVLALMGPSGAGKTTLLDLLARRKSNKAKRKRSFFLSFFLSLLTISFPIATGDTEGTVLLNGVRADREAFTRMSKPYECTMTSSLLILISLVGYVEQEDVHFPSQTVLEALQFAAECRLPNHYSRAKRSSVVNRVLDLLDLRAIQDVIVRGLTKEERKRLTIGVELAADPHILFLGKYRASKLTRLLLSSLA
jgi:ABC-type multidrug transport system ATPase subunit